MTSPNISAITSSEVHRRTAYWLLAAFLIFASLWLGVGRKYLNFDNPSQDIVHLQATEVDYHQLYPALESKHTFAQTFQWWREPWRADQWVGAYWRPLSMQAWWIESHAFGEDRSFNWMRVSVLLSIVFDLLLLQLFRILFKHRLYALVGLAIFVLPGSWMHAITPLAISPRIWNADLLLTQGWKDQPDLFANSLILAAMICTFRKRYGWALLFGALAPCFKESGLLAYPLLLGVVTYQGELKRLPKWIYAGVGAVYAAILLARYLAGPMVFHFHTHGGHAGAVVRYTNAMLPLSVLLLTSFGAALLGLALFSLLILKPNRPLVWLRILLPTLLLAILIAALQGGVTYDVAFAQFLMDGWQSTLLFTLWLVVTFLVWQQREFLKPAIFLTACALLVAVPFATVTGALEHVLTLARAFQAGYGACVALSLGRAVVAVLQRSPKFAARFAA